MALSAASLLRTGTSLSRPCSSQGKGHLPLKSFGSRDGNCIMESARQEEQFQTAHLHHQILMLMDPAHAGGWMMCATS